VSTWLQTFTEQDVRELMASHRLAMAQPQQWGYLSADGAVAAVITRAIRQNTRWGYYTDGWKVDRSLRFPGGWVQEPDANTKIAPTLAEAQSIAMHIVGAADPETTRD
jgi:hypothetical protein